MTLSNMPDLQLPLQQHPIAKGFPALRKTEEMFIDKESIASKDELLNRL